MRGVCRYRQHSGRAQGVRLTPLCVVLDGVSSLPRTIRTGGFGAQ
jgi:hypothetical protein